MRVGGVKRMLACWLVAGLAVLPGAAPAGAQTGTISTFAGTGAYGFSGDGGPATAARFASPEGVAVAPDGSVVISDLGNRRVRRVAPDGTISTLAGSGMDGFGGDGGPATAAQFRLPAGVAVAADGSVLIADVANHRIRRVAADGTISTFAGTATSGSGGGDGGFGGDGGPATGAQLRSPFGVAVAPDGSVLFSETSNRRIRRVAPDGTISTFAGTGASGFGGDGGPATAAQLNPSGVAVAPDGSVLITSTTNQRVRRVSPDGTISTLAGTGVQGFDGDGGPATAAQLDTPYAVAVAPDGSVVIADTGNHRIRRIALDGTISTLAGTGTAGFNGDGGPATSAKLSDPIGIAVTHDGSVLIAEQGTQRVRRVDAGLVAAAPTITITAPADGATFVKGQSVSSDYACVGAAGGSGVASCVGTVANGAVVPTDSVGTKTFTVTASDYAGNTATMSVSYSVTFSFGGFLRPVDNLPTLNSTNAGAAIPVKFSLAGDQGLDIFAAGYPRSEAITCDSTAPVDGVEETVTAGANALTYDVASDTYKYVWKTDKSWAVTCRQLVLKLTDGTFHRANFKFR
jgi:hypothetical protein